MTFGEKLQKLRAREGLSQDALAELLDVSRQAVSKWERDETMPASGSGIGAGFWDGFPALGERTAWHGCGGCWRSRIPGGYGAGCF